MEESRLVGRCPLMWRATVWGHGRRRLGAKPTPILMPRGGRGERGEEDHARGFTRARQGE